MTKEIEKAIVFLCVNEDFENVSHITERKKDGKLHTYKLVELHPYGPNEQRHYGIYPAQSKDAACVRIEDPTEHPTIIGFQEALESAMKEAIPQIVQAAKEAFQVASQPPVEAEVEADEVFTAGDISVFERPPEAQSELMYDDTTGRFDYTPVSVESIVQSEAFKEAVRATVFEALKFRKTDDRHILELGGSAILSMEG